MQTLSYLTDVIGPRLTGSPGLKRANGWTRDKLSSWGLAGAHLEAWGPFGRGWSLEQFSVNLVEPQPISLLGSPKAWSPGFNERLVADVVHVDAKAEADLEKYQGKLKGAIVLAGPARTVKANMAPLFARMNDDDLRRLANRRGGSGVAAARSNAEANGAQSASQPPERNEASSSNAQPSTVQGEPITPASGEPSADNAPIARPSGSIAAIGRKRCLRGDCFRF